MRHVEKLSPELIVLKSTSVQFMKERKITIVRDVVNLSPQLLVLNFTSVQFMKELRIMNVRPVEKLLVGLSY